MAAAVRAKLVTRLGDPELGRVGAAVVFPELSRYSYIRDVAKTSALELAYVLGMDVNFSLGKLQMKPSFAEEIETLAGVELRSRFPRIAAEGRDAQTTRGLRIRRLHNDEDQIDYLAVFLLLMQKRFPELSAGGPEAVRVFAAAYNSGPQRSRDDLDVLARVQFFPYGKNYPGEQFCYTDIALLFYSEETQ